jgi:hypothetical protein
MQSVIIATIFSLLFSGGVGGCRTKNFNVPPRQSQSSTGHKDNPVEYENQTSGDLKVVAQGSHSAITDPFVAVVRDEATFAELAKLEPSLAKLTVDFKTNVVVAAFLGQRNTGGYSIDMTRSANGEIQVAEKSPGKDMMVPQMITAPFKIVSFTVAGTSPVKILAGEAFRKTTQLYRIDKGSFTISGGFAGRSQTYSLAGKIQITRLDNLITVGFAVVSTGAGAERSLRDVATGVVTGNSFSIARMSRGSLVDPPTDDLRVSGKFVDPNGLSMILDTPWTDRS